MIYSWCIIWDKRHITFSNQTLNDLYDKEIINWKHSMWGRSSFIHHYYPTSTIYIQVIILLFTSYIRSYYNQKINKTINKKIFFTPGLIRSSRKKKPFIVIYYLVGSSQSQWLVINIYDLHDKITADDGGLATKIFTWGDCDDKTYYNWDSISSWWLGYSCSSGKRTSGRAEDRWDSPALLMSPCSPMGLSGSLCDALAFWELPRAQYEASYLACFSLFSSCHHQLYDFSFYHGFFLVHWWLW